MLTVDLLQAALQKEVSCVTSEVSQEVTTEESVFPARARRQAQSGCRREGHPRGQVPGEVLLTDPEGRQQKAQGLAEAPGQLLRGSLHVSQRTGCLSKTEPSDSPCIDLLVSPSNGGGHRGGGSVYLKFYKMWLCFHL